jgi:hypothetical protein
VEGFSQSLLGWNLIVEAEQGFGVWCARGADVDAKALALPFHVGHAAAVQAVVVEPGFADAHHPRARRCAHQQVVDVGSCTPSESGCTPTVHHRLSWASARPCTWRIPRSWCRCTARGRHGPPPCHAGCRRCAHSVPESSDGNANRRTWQQRGAGPAQIVCVGLADAIAVPRISSMRSFSARVFSSAGKRTPTPCVRPPEALAGVIQATLPATG